MRRLSKLFQMLLASSRSIATCPHCLLPIGGMENVCPNCRRLLRFEGIEELRATSRPAGSRLAAAHAGAGGQEGRA
ncbi:hypothetical protein MELA_00514 [Candidatus Methylomirabilis lanthanidiphila]|uniref:Double zinc ribbon n=1 Tax=Candidatus Methylomirabilis lanthanidiphila TaxID=2211376 RepID=A0A564ZHX7_9BACT|nr:hypothetical protein [Candidatus Methylomirabilis lanthanidiphila]VUZ84148.1 hypothetical protein MELA_00514 [Candidatus Methylomirabilis lanthanidiphila]